MTANTTPEAGEIWARSLRTWMEGWAATVGLSFSPDGPPPDPFQLWRRSLDQWIEGWSAFFDRILSMPETVDASGRLLNAMLNVEKPLREQTTETMQQWLEFINMPSRRDLVRLGRQLNDANARLDELQEQVEALEDRVADSAAAQPDSGRRAAATTRGGDA